MLLDTPRINTQLDLLYRVTSEFNAGLNSDITEVLAKILDIAVTAIGTTDAVLCITNEHAELETGIMIDGLNPAQCLGNSANAIFTEGLIEWVWQHGQTALLADTSTDERWYKNPPIKILQRAKSALSVPIQKTSDSTIGVLTITSADTNRFDGNDLVLLTIVANQIAFALINMRLFKTEQHRRRVAESLSSIAHTVNSTLNLGEVLNLILEQLSLVVDYDSSSILLYEEESRSLAVKAARGFENERDALSVRLPFDEQIPNYQAIIMKKPILIGDVDSAPHWVKSPSSQKVKSWIGAPLVAKNEVVGILTVDSYEPHKYSDENLEIVAAFADQAATAVANAQAMSQLKRAEASYSALFEDSTDMITITDYDGVILNVNRKACQILRRPKDAITGLNITFFAPPLKGFLQENTPLLRAWREASIDVDIVDAYRQKVPLDIRCRHIQFGDKERLEWVGRDITRRKDIERMRQDLVNMLIHDLRGPLGNLINTIDLVKMMVDVSNSNPNLPRFLEMGKRTGRTLTDLVDSILDVSRLEQGEVPLQRSPTRIKELIQEVKEQVEPQAAAKAINFNIEPTPDAVPEIWIDGSLIRRVLVNLVGNAIKYAPEEATVWLTTAIEPGQIHFAVKDNGPGISKNNQTRIFDKFSRLESGADSPAGVGLGLAFCKLAVEAHGGQISVESAGIPGQGSIFHVKLPLTSEADD